MKKLILFCGGKPHELYGNKPKPLFVAFNGVSIISKFLSSMAIGDYQEIVLLVEESYGEEYRGLTKEFGVTIFECKDGSTTYEKALLYASSEDSSDAVLYLTYPDIFAEDSFYRECQENSVTIVPVRSRFPSVIREPFSTKLKGISYTRPKLPANPSYIYGGLLVISQSTLRLNMAGYTGEKNFELEFLNYLATKEILDAVIYYGRWATADGARDINVIDCE